MWAADARPASQMAWRVVWPLECNLERFGEADSDDPVKKSIRVIQTNNIFAPKICKTTRKLLKTPQFDFVAMGAVQHFML